ncbi:unnamed protein product, partial [Acidithrix sp. C25]
VTPPKTPQLRVQKVANWGVFVMDEIFYKANLGTEKMPP